MKTIEELLAFVAEAGKVLHMDDSHGALRGNLQTQLATTHRVTNPDSGYYDYPTVQDVYGTSDAGQVVHSKGGQLTRSDYKKADDGSYSLSKHTAVKKSYVSEALLVGESEVQESIGIQEAALDKDGRGEICLIKPCTGSMGHYTAEALKRTATAGVFGKGTKMFIDHQTADERAARPEGSVFKQAAVLESKAAWKESGKEGPGLYAPIKAYSEYVPFINERANDIGVSVRGRIIPTGKIVNGVPEVQEFTSALSVDFVTKAGAGGKLITVYESFRSNRPTPEIHNKEGVIDMEVKESDFKALQDQAALVPKLVTRLDRADEQLNRFAVRDAVSAAFVGESGLPERARTRISKPFLTLTYVPPMKDGVLDVPVLEGAIKTAIDEEKLYLQENGVLPKPTVRKLGADGKEVVEATRTEDEIVAEADRILQDSTRSLCGMEPIERKSK